MDLGEYFDFTMESYRKAQLKDMPDALKALQKEGVYDKSGDVYGVYKGKPFKTLSKKIELFSKRYVDMGIDPMPVYQRPKKIPRDRFRIVVGRNAYITQGTSTNNALLNELAPENTLWLHPDAAGQLDIRHGDLVEVSSDAGKGRLKARITEEIRKDTVYMDSGFGPLSKGLSNVFGKGASIAAILEDHADDISGNMAMHETMVSISKIRRSTSI